MENQKVAFMDEEVWILTFGGAFQRANIYLKSATEDEKKKFRQDIKKYVRKLVDQQYRVATPTSEKHIENLIMFCDWSAKEYFSILNDGKLKLGVAQKLINLYLKYLWCLGQVQIPPHCPFDRIIISKVSSYDSVLNWTEIDSPTVYKSLVSKAQIKAGTTPLAEWELNEFSRR